MTHVAAQIWAAALTILGAARTLQAVQITQEAVQIWAAAHTTPGAAQT